MGKTELQIQCHQRVKGGSTTGDAKVPHSVLFWDI